MNYLYDTNIFIYYLTGDDTVSEFFSEGFLNTNYVVISPIVRIELLCFSGLSDDEAEVIEDFLEDVLKGLFYVMLNAAKRSETSQYIPKTLDSSFRFAPLRMTSAGGDGAERPLRDRTHHTLCFPCFPSLSAPLQTFSLLW